MAKVKTISRLGLIAGAGGLPREIVLSAIREGHEMVAVALEGMANQDGLKECIAVLQVHLGDVQKTIEFLTKQGVQEIFFAGKVDKTKLFASGIRMDSTAAAFLKALPSRNDDAILAGLADIFNRAGLKVLDSTRFLKTVLPKKGVLTRKPVSHLIEEEVQYGYKMAKQIADMDIGQTVVVKDKMVLAVEAIEGTDQAILRGGSLGQGGAVVVKVAKPGQDFRFDVPTIGTETIRICVQAGIKALAFDSGATIILDLDEVVKMADANEIALLSL